MITSIAIHLYKSFHSTAHHTISFDAHTPPKPVFFYGINGAGKSAIGEVIHGCTSGDPNLSHCSVSMSNQIAYRCLVYNQGFVDRVIRSADGVPGIFTLGEHDAETQKEIEDKEAESASLAAARISLREQITKSIETGKGVLETAISGVWKAHGEHAQSPFRDLLKGYHTDRKKFFTDLETYDVPNDQELDTLGQLKARLEAVNSTESFQVKMALDLSGLQQIEGDSIWMEPIAVSRASRLSTMIEKLGNSDWVGQGRKFSHAADCPFCQQTLPTDFVAELSLLLDGDRQVKVDRIQALADGYAVGVVAVEAAATALLAHPFAQEEPELQAAWELLYVQLRANVAVMRAKVEKPGEMVSVDPVDAGPLKAAIESANARIETFNKVIADRDNERERVRQMFWQVLRRERGPVYDAYHASKAPLVEDLTRDRLEDAELGKALDAVTERLRSLRTQQTGIGAAVERINARLKGMGINAYSIASKQGEGSLYCLARPGLAESAMTSLSEGEKTLISFLYYLELLAGSDNDAGGAVDLGKTIAVIDDPISSLSHNFVFDVASMIHDDLIKPLDGVPKPRQVIVLTHNLFFLHELLRQLLGSAPLTKASNKCQILRVVKTEHTQVLPMKASELMNDYQALWQVLKDARDTHAPAIMVPNAMRCILEHFFWFTHEAEKFKSALRHVAKEDSTFNALARFLDRGSHKDGINVTVMDYNHYDLPYYFDKFRAVFKAAGFERHYLANMGEVEEVPVAAPILAGPVAA